MKDRVFLCIWTAFADEREPQDKVTFQLLRPARGGSDDYLPYEQRIKVVGPGTVDYRATHWIEAPEPPDPLIFIGFCEALAEAATDRAGRELK